MVPYEMLATPTWIDPVFLCEDHWLGALEWAHASAACLYRMLPIYLSERDDHDDLMPFA
tara:strand:+ start:518 stop:694 length:177 start_codon:yes stop_codon:yes gene_type:complete